MKHPFTALDVANKKYMQHMYKLSSSLISNRDHIFIGQVWQELFRLANAKLKMSLVYHPQTVKLSWSTRPICFTH